MAAMGKLDDLRYAMSNVERCQQMYEFGLSVRRRAHSYHTDVVVRVTPY
jgi:hypothetical protein